MDRFPSDPGTLHRLREFAFSPGAAGKVTDRLEQWDPQNRSWYSQRIQLEQNRGRRWDELREQVRDTSLYHSTLGSRRENTTSGGPVSASRDDISLREALGTIPQPNRDGRNAPLPAADSTVNMTQSVGNGKKERVMTIVEDAEAVQSLFYGSPSKRRVTGHIPRDHREVVNESLSSRQRQHDLALRAAQNRLSGVAIHQSVFDDFETENYDPNISSGWDGLNSSIHSLPGTQQQQIHQPHHQSILQHSRLLQHGMQKLTEVGHLINHDRPHEPTRMRSTPSSLSTTPLSTSRNGRAKVHVHVTLPPQKNPLQTITQQNNRNDPMLLKEPVQTKPPQANIPLTTPQFHALPSSTPHFTSSGLPSGLDAIWSSLAQADSAIAQLESSTLVAFRHADAT